MKKPGQHIFLFLCAAVLAFANQPQQRGQLFRLLQSSDDEVVVELLPPQFSERTISVDGHLMKTFEAPLAGWTMEAGKPQLPIVAFLVALPPGKRPVVEVVESKFDLFEQQEVAPAPSYSFTEEGEAIAEYHLNKIFYETHNTFYPAKTAELAEVAFLRDVQTAKIVVNPFQYNPVTKQVKKFSHLKIRVRFVRGLEKSSRQWQAIGGRDPFFEPLYGDLLLNAAQANSWRGVDPNQIQSLLDDTTDDWFTVAQTYYRLPIITDGIYRLNYSDLLGYGIDLTSLNNSTAALYYKGTSQPLRVETSDVNPVNWFIEFYARRNYGINSYFDRYNDTSQYFLTWNDALPRRYTAAAVTPSTITDTVKWHRATLHQEQDAKYFFGVTQDDIQTTDDVPGEGWYWNDFSNGTSRNFTFTIDSVQRGTSASFELRARLHGMTLCQSTSCRAPSRHRAIFRLNGTIIDSIDWNDNTEAIFSKTFNQSLLRTGSNTLNVRSKTWSSADSNITKFYLDWFEITYSRPLQMLGTTFEFVNEAPASFDTLTYVVRGISADSATVYDVSGSRRITTLVPLGSQTLAFSDTVSGVKKYVIVKDGGKLTPLSLTQKTFLNLRTNTIGADYIVIAHAVFRNEAQQLAQYRASANKLRVSVVEVQDIYDEFNYGLLDPEAIRSFLKRAYYFWKKPSPTFVVMFGDASWDYKKNMTTSTKQNYVPSFGNPPSDNAFVSFDSARNYLPYMIIGRIPVESPTQAANVVSKLVNYEHPPVTDWNKKFLFIAGGNTATEKYVFNAWSDDFINRYVTAYPVGGTSYRVYKNSDAIIDGENRQYLQQTINDGVVFINFIGHSGGRVWNVDVGDINALQNTNGMLPFVSSVSCNVGFFSDPRSNVLSEDFLLAENRGGIAAWAASSIGYGSVGRTLVDKFLSALTRNYSRDIGTLTTISRLHFWITSGSATPLVIQTLNLHPLIGDPLTSLAIPLYPDFSVPENGLAVNTPFPTSDSAVTLSVNVENLGLMAGSQIYVSVRDNYTDEQGKFVSESDIVPPFYLDDFIGTDSFNVVWNVRGKPGSHTVIVTIDPKDSIQELNESNNTRQKTFYVYRNQILTVKPPSFAVVSTTPTLVVTVPASRDTTPLTFTFEIDTASDFSSSAKITSPTVIPGKVSALWTPPPLSMNRIYYWRSRSTDGRYDGAWTSSSFFLSSSAPSGDTVQWRQAVSGQFQQNLLSKVTLTTQGITMQVGDSTLLYARSVGARYNQVAEFYSVLNINDIEAIGYWWENSWSYLAGRYNPATGDYLLKGFDLLQIGYTDSLLNFLQNTPNGYYVMLTVVRDGKQNMTETLYQLFEQLGATQIRSVTSGQSWCMISRKGDGVAIIEDYKPTGIAEGTVMLANFYKNGEAQVVTKPIGPAQKWYKAAWDISGITSTTTVNVSLLGIRPTGTIDTVMNLPIGTSSEADLSSIDPITYPRLQLLAKFSNTDGFTTPILRRWDISYSPCADLAISAWTYSASPETVQATSPVSLTLDVYNIGYNNTDSVRVTFSVAEDTAARTEVLIPSLTVGTQQRVQAQLTVGGLGPRTVVAQVKPKTGVNDLIDENNTATIPIIVTGSAQISHHLRILFDNVEIRDGDYVSPKPLIAVEYTGDLAATVGNPPQFHILLDGKPVFQQGQPAATDGQKQIQSVLVQDSLNDGMHTIEVTSKGQYQPFTLKKISFQVLAATRLLEVHNYPNPFSRETYFTFIITGGRIPDEVRIKVFTVAGRMLKELHLDRSQLQIGFNRITWDGRDEDGDEIANGYYFYKILMKTGSETMETLQKLAKLR